MAPLRELRDAFRLGPVDEHECDERGERPQRDEPAVGRRQRGVASAPSPATPSMTTAARRVGSDGNARTARIAANPPATAPSAAGNPSRGAAAAPIAPSASALTAATGRHGEPGAPGTALAWPRGPHAAAHSGSRAIGRGGPGGRTVLTSVARNDCTGQSSGGVAGAPPDRARADARGPARRRPGAKRGPSGSFVATSTGHRAQTPRRRSPRPGSRPLRGRLRPGVPSVPSDRRRGRRLRSRADRARGRRARRAGRSTASARAAPGRRGRTGGRRARRRHPHRETPAQRGASTRGRTGCTIAPAVRGRGATVIGVGSATRA